MKQKVCNQFLVKDIHRDTKYPSTLKCACCGQITNLNMKFPLEMSTMIKFLANFTKLHKDMGCNEKFIEPDITASSDVNYGISL